MKESDEKYLFEANGNVINGKKEATKLGYPTANINCKDDIPSGIYAGAVTWRNDIYPAAIYKKDGDNMVEAYLLDFSGNLYGQSITIRAFHKVRDVKIFPNKDELTTAIAQDIATIKNLCSQE